MTIVVTAFLSTVDPVFLGEIHKLELLRIVWRNEPLPAQIMSFRVNDDIERIHFVGIHLIQHAFLKTVSFACDAWDGRIVITSRRV